MSDPYSVLGISKNATDDEVKTAYRNLARKYHPDAYADNPLADLAQEKMQEINAAYDQIMNERRNGAKTSSGGWNPSQNANSQYADIRQLISAARYDDAQELLDGVPIASRDAEWYFLNGSVQYKRGWFDNAFTSFSTACRMDPQNEEYRAALNHLQRQRSGFGGSYGGYRQSNYGNGSSGCSACDVCTTLWCADTCCECMGGDLISCC